MISGISASVSGLLTFGNKLSNTAHNIANSNADGYKAKVATITEDDKGLPKVNLVKSNTSGALVEEYGVTRETFQCRSCSGIPSDDDRAAWV